MNDCTERQLTRMDVDALVSDVLHARRRMFLRELQRAHGDEPLLVLEAAAFYRAWRGVDANDALATARADYERLAQGD